MALKSFIVDIDLNKNQLLNAVVQNLATAPASPVQGQIYYNTTDGILYGRTASSWINLMSVGGGAYTHPAHPAFNPTLTGNNVLATFQTNTEGHVIAASTRVLTLADLGYTPYVHPNDGVSMGSALTGAAVISNVIVNAQGHVTGFATRNLTAADLGAAIINDAVTNTTSTWSGTKIQNEITAAMAGVPTPSITDYNASTNTPNITTPAGGTVKKGDYYVVTVAGTFFGEAVSIGDVLIAKQLNPSAIGHWIRVERNIPDIQNATNAVVGIARFATQAEVTAGTLANVSIDPVTLKARIDALVLLRKFSANIGTGAATSFTITHNLNTTDVDVSVKEGATGAEVMVAWTTPTVNTVVITTNTAPATNAYRVNVIG